MPSHFHDYSCYSLAHIFCAWRKAEMDDIPVYIPDEVLQRLLREYTEPRAIMFSDTRRSNNPRETVNAIKAMLIEDAHTLRHTKPAQDYHSVGDMLYLTLPKALFFGNIS